MSKLSVQSINEIVKFIDEKSLLPIYFLFGEDNFAINYALELIQKKVDNLILSDFDREVINIDKSTDLTAVIDLFYTFPFGGGKKFLVLKNFENIKDKKLLTDYINNPSNFTILVIIYNGAINQNEFNKEPFVSLIKNNYLFEAKVLKGEELVNWFVKLAEKNNFELSHDNAKTIIEIVGEEKSLLEIQLQKFISYSQGRKLSLEEMIKISSPTKQYSIFDLLDSIGKANKAKSLEIAYNLIENGTDIIAIINMISKYILTISHVLEMISQKIPDKEAAQKIETSLYFYIRCKDAKYFLNNEKLENAAKALLNADLSVKSTSMDPKTIINVLISELLTQINVDPFTYN